MRVSVTGTFVFGLICGYIFIPTNYGLEAEKSVGDDEIYKPRKWSQVRDGPYRMVVSSRDEEDKVDPPDIPGPSESPEKTKEAPARESEEEKIKEPEEEEIRTPSRGSIKHSRRKPSRVNWDPPPQSTSSAPNTMSYKVYSHFRPIERGLPRESIVPFLDFGKKLSTGRTPSGVNSIEGSSTPVFGALGVTTEREEEDLYHEDMDVSVIRLKAVERNVVPRVRAPSRNPSITSYYRKRVPVRTAEALTASITPSTTVEATPSTTAHTTSTTTPPITTTTSTTSATTTTTKTTTTAPLTTIKTTTSTPSTTTKITTTASTSTTPPPITTLKPSTMSHAPTPRTTSEIPLSSESSITSTQNIILTNSDLQSNESKTKVRILPPHPDSPTTIDPHLSISPLLEEVTENPESNSTILYPESSLSTQVPKPTAKILSTAVVTSISVKETFRHPRIKTGQVSVETPKTESSKLVRKESEENTTRESPLPMSSTESTKIKVSTSRPKFHKSNLEYHASFTTTKLPSTTTTHKPLNRALYSAHQREHISKLLSLHKGESAKVVNRTETPPVTNPIQAENKTKMFLTIRSRLSNQSATYRSTYRRNGTKPIPPVLRVIATPSSYIEVPKIPSRVTNRTATTDSSPTWTSVVSTTEVRYSKVGKSTNEDQTSEVESEVKSQKNAQEEEQVDPPVPNIPQEVLSSTDEMTESPIDSTTMAEHFTTSPSSTVQSTTVKSVTFSVTTGPDQPGLSWVYVNQKNLSVTRIPSDGVDVTNNLGVATYVLAALGVVPLILGGFILVRQLILKSKKKMLDESEYSSEYNRTPLPAKLPRIPSHVNWENEKAVTNPSSSNINNNSSNASPPSVPPPPPPPPATKWEFPRDKLRLQTLLGEGNFGQVWKAEADDISGHEGLTRLVAVKTVKEGSSAREREDLLRELGIMQDLGSHPNVVTLLGCCTDREPYLLIMEYVMYGKMLTFLREHRTKAHYFNFSDLSSALTSRDLTVFAYCVARGMEYIVAKGIIHRDLAARNILVDHNKLCKIADFGMSRNVRDTGEIYEQKPNRGALPIRWMAPEALHYSLFTHKSDVWSFGILVWEIITLGSTPYSTMGAREVMRRVREGFRLEKPVHCKQDLYRVVSRCWASDPNKRPTFTELKQDLASLLSDPSTNGAYVDLDALTEEMSSHSC